MDIDRAIVVIVRGVGSLVAIVGTVSIHAGTYFKRWWDARAGNGTPPPNRERDQPKSAGLAGVAAPRFKKAADTPNENP